MTGLAITTVYVLGWLTVAVVVVRAFHRDQWMVEDPFDSWMATAVGCLIGIFWPLVGPVALIRWLAKRETLAERRARLQVEKDKRVRELNARIAQLERELNIGQGAS